MRESGKERKQVVKLNIFQAIGSSPVRYY